jgi:hypothetical protein
VSGFAKLYSTILDSSLWVGTDPAVKVVWITMLAKADAYGVVQASVPGLAHAAVVSLEDAERALGIFLAPDEHSRTEDHDGRRVEKIDGGWKLLNYQKYREMQTPRQEQWARSQRERRRKGRASTSGGALTCQRVSTEAEAEAEAEAEGTARVSTPSPHPETLGSGNGAAPTCPHDQIVALYHEELPELPQVRKWTAKRQEHLRARWREDEERQSLDWWRSYFQSVSASDFLMGRNGKGWKCDLEWLVKESNLVKVIEGRYAENGRRGSVHRLDEVDWEAEKARYAQ